NEASLRRGLWLSFFFITIRKKERAMQRVMTVFGAMFAIFAMACESKTPPAGQPEQQPLEGPAWTFVGEPDLNLQGGKARVSRGRVETVITLLGGTTVVTLRKR